jgi:hypothetical protein
MAVPSKAKDAFLFSRSSPFIPVVTCGLMGHGGCLILVAGPMKLAKDPGCMWREGNEPLLFLYLLSLLVRDDRSTEKSIFHSSKNGIKSSN